MLVFILAGSEKQVLPLSDCHFRIFKCLFFRESFFFLIRAAAFRMSCPFNILAFCFVCFGSKSCIHSPSIARHNQREFFELKEIIFLFYREEGRVPSFQVIQEYIKLVWCDFLTLFLFCSSIWFTFVNIFQFAWLFSLFVEFQWKKTRCLNLQYGPIKRGQRDVCYISWKLNRAGSTPRSQAVRTLDYVILNQPITLHVVPERYLTIIPRARMGSESLVHVAEGRMSYWLRGHESERNNCFSKIQLVGEKEYQDSTSFAS